MTLAHLEASVSSTRTGIAHGRIRVVYVLDNLRIGGTELNAVRTAEHLDRDRFDLQVAAMNGSGPLADRFRAIDVPVFEFPMRSLHDSTMLRAGWRFVRFLREHRIQVVHSHDMYSNVFAAPWARLAGTPAVIASRRWWHSLPNSRLRIGNRVAFRLADVVLANSAQVAESVRSVDRVGRHRIRVVTNFADDRAFDEPTPNQRSQLREAFGMPAEAIVVGCVARLSPVKDHPTLLRGFALTAAKHPQARLLLIGDGPSRKGLTDLVAQMGLESTVTFAGERQDAVNLHHALDISVLCSLSEGFPNSLVEAMAAARPTVATSVGGNLDAVADGVTGFLVPPSDPQALAERLDRLVTDPVLRRRMGAAGRVRALERHRAGPVIRSLQALYEELVPSQTG